MNYKQTTEWLFSRLPMYKAKGVGAFRPKLENIKLFCERLGNPHQKIKSLHIAGTNGKGSSSHSLASVLQEAGYKVGLYTSPHLKDFRERIRLNGELISEDFVINFVKDNKDFLEKENFSFFEVSVAMAFYFFYIEKVDIAVIEVGLGGLLDSTNIITPEVSLITNIGKDHTDVLGETLKEIALQKVGIIKENIPVVISEYNAETAEVFNLEAQKKNAPIYFAHTKEAIYEMDLKGDYQPKNQKGVLQALDILKEKNWKISEENIKNGLKNVVKNTNLQGRWQTLGENPKIICDTGHNAHGLQLVVNQINKQKFENLHIVFGVVKDKDLKQILPLMPPKATYYFCCPNVERGLSAEILQQEALLYYLKGDCYDSVNLAFMQAKKNAQKEDFIFVGGSTFVVAEVV